MKKIVTVVLLLISLICNAQEKANFNVMGSTYGDLQLLRYEVPGFKELTLKEKELLYYLYEAALSGRDIIYDQKSKHGLLVRKSLESIYFSYKGDRKTEEWKKFEDYAGRFWFSNGYFHHYGNEKFFPECDKTYFSGLVKQSRIIDKLLKEANTKTLEEYVSLVTDVVYNPNIQPKCVDLRAGVDNVAASSNNFYEGVTQKEVETFYDNMPTKGNAPSWGLNSKVVKENGVIKEKVWKQGGMYGKAINKIIFWLEKASTVAENEKQKTSIDLLIKFYKTGDLKYFDDYSIAWVKDTESKIDFVNGFIEVYLDAIGKKGSYESVVNFKDMEATKRIATIAKNAQWFEDNSPLIPTHKKKTVTGITAKAITVLVESGDAAPSTPVGINLPNADWIRKDHGSKSVSLSNIINSYNVATTKKGTLDEFGLNDAIKGRIKKYGALASDLHTDMHECIGHASGQINPGVETTDKTLKNYASCLEEARADLVALYYVLDKKLIDIGVMPSLEVGKAEYDSYLMNGLMTQLTRIKLGDELEEAHMRNRQLNASWVYEKGKAENVVELVKKDGKTYVQINDYEKCRILFGELLREIQRIKSEGDFKAGQNLVEGYGVKINKELHKEILDRYAKLELKPYRGFIQPRVNLVKKGETITDVNIEYPSDFIKQMLEYGRKYSFLPVYN